MTIYLDVVFLENVCMNSIILFATGLVTKTKCKIFRTVISSSIGAIYVIAKYVSKNTLYSNILMHVLLSVIMVYLAFSPNNIKYLFKYIVIFYLTSFVFGGCAFALLYYIKPQKILYSNGILKGTYPIKVAFLGAFIGLIILKIAFKLIKNRMGKNDMICNVKIVNDEKEIEIKAIVDSGNLLKEPISGYSVIVIEKKSLEGMIENKILDNLNEIVSGKYYDFKEEYISKFRLIPFASLGKQNGMLVGFKPDYLEIEFDGIKKKINKAIIGIYDKEITKNDEYTGIVGLEILEERGKMKSEYNRNIKV